MATRSVGLQDPEEDQLVESLVHDANFVDAVKCGQTLAAAEAGVRVLKRLHGFASENGAVANRLKSMDSLTKLAPARIRPGTRVPGFGGGAMPSTPAPLLPSQMEPWQWELLRDLTLEMLALEECVPWARVRRHWRTRRTAWRRSLKLTETPADLVARLKELREALLADDSALPGCGEEWLAALSTCVHSGEGLEHLAIAWDELRSEVAAWLEGPLGQENAAPLVLFSRPLSPAAAERCAARVLAAVRRFGEVDASSPEQLLAQLPIEAILCHDASALSALHEALGWHAANGKQQSLVAALLAHQSSGADPVEDDDDEGDMTDIES